MSIKTVVELDLVGYGRRARVLDEILGAEVVSTFNDQLQGFVDRGLQGIGADRSKCVLATTGDGAILAFNAAAEAHRFAMAVHKAAQGHNETHGGGLAER